MKRPNVIILGAGAAGLAAAQVLSKKGRSALLLEARDRIGGRIHTIPGGEYSMPVELGAEFVHGRPETTFQMLREAKLLAFDLPFDHRQRRNGHLAHLDDFSEELNKVMGGLAHLGKRDMSFAEYLRNRRSSPGLNDALKFAINFVQGFDAADPERISAKSLAEEMEGIGDLSNQTQFRLLDGYGALMEHLRGTLNEKKVEIKLQTEATQIRWGKSRVEVQTTGVNGAEVFRAARVIITLPLGVLQLPPETPHSLRFSPDVPEKRKAAMQLGSGPIVKAVLRFREAFWEEPSAARRARTDPGLRDAVFLHSPESAFPTWWTARPLRLPVLTAWAGGPKAVALAGRSRRELQRAALDSLGRLLNQRPAKLLTMLEHFDCHDWASDPFSRGAYSYVTVGGARARSSLAKPIGDTLFFAGEATDTEGQASTVAGALASGQRAANEVLRE